jgi:probable rRNA maturation factor
MAKHIIEIFNGQDKIEINGGQMDLIREAAAVSLRAEGIRYDCEICVEIADNAAIQAMNRDYRGKDAPTDVLSFPLIGIEKLPRLRKFIDDGYFDGDENPENKAVLLGDIIISAEKAKEQSAEFNQSFERELVFLTIHSVLHLLGYDHELSEKDDIAMREKQRQILEIYGRTHSGVQGGLDKK